MYKLFFTKIILEVQLKLDDLLIADFNIESMGKTFWWKNCLIEFLYISNIGLESLVLPNLYDDIFL